MRSVNGFDGGRLLIVAFEGWNDAGEAATTAAQILVDRLGLTELMSIDPELYFDYQFNRPVVELDENGTRRLRWPGAAMLGPRQPSSTGRTTLVKGSEKAVSERSVDVLADTEVTVTGAAGDIELDDDSITGPGASGLHVLLGTEPARSWKGFAEEFVDAALAHDIQGVVFLGAMLADTPHTRPLSVFATSDNGEVRDLLGLESSTYEGPVGILSVIAEQAEAVGIPTVALWASVPHYVHNSPSPKAVLSLLAKLEELTGLSIPRGDLEVEAQAWEASVDAVAAEDEGMSGYIAQLEQVRDAADTSDTSGEAIAQEFERYLRRRGHDRDDGGWHPAGS